MANELRHTSVGTVLTQAEYEAVTGHSFDGQATGDMPYASSSTTLSRLAIGTTNQVVIVSGGIPAWSSTVTSATLATPTLSGVATGSWVARWSGGTAVTAAQYEVTRDADGTNQLHLNVPTGATFEFSVNDVPEMLLSATNLTPGASDGNALGSASVNWADLFLASGGVINFDNGNMTITHSAGSLAIAGGTLTLSSDLAITEGGTGASTAANARTNLGLGTGDSPTFTNLTISGDLTVQGDTVTVDVATLTVEDPLISLAKANSSTDALDIGFYGLYDTTGSQDLHAGIFRDADDNKFKAFVGLQSAPTTTVNVSGTGYTAATLVLGTLETTTIEIGASATDTTLARASAGDVSIEGNVIYRAGGTDVPVTDGGTGASSASDARTNLGVAIGSDVQAFHARLSDVAGASWAQGDVMYHDGSNLVRLAAGASGYFLKTNGAGANPAWAAATGLGGDVVGPSSATDNAITRFDSTSGKLVQDSSVTISDTGAIAAPSVGSVIPFFYADQTSFPSASTYHGAIAHSHADGAMYFAHGGSWVRLIESGGPLGTPSSGTLTNATGLPVSGITASTSTALGVGSVELGHATDTTLSRSSGGVLAVEGVVVPTISSTHTLTNKRIDPRTNTTSSSATPSINTDTTDVFTITAQAEAITSMTTNLSGTPVNGQTLVIRFKDNGTARAITWGASFTAVGITLPTTTTANKLTYVGVMYNSTSAKWDALATVTEA